LKARAPVDDSKEDFVENEKYYN